nr:hypothetical protein [Bacilli bacterium]
IVSSQNGLDKYIKKLVLATKKTKYNDPYYSPEDYTLFINKEYIIDDANIVDKFLNERTAVRSEVLSYNMILLQQIMHEMDHVMLEKEMVEENIDILHTLTNLATNEQVVKRFNIKNIIQSHFRYLYNGFMYELNHDLAPFERRAEINSYRALNSVLEELKHIDFNERLIYGQKFIYGNKLDSIITKPYDLLDTVTNSPAYDFMNLLSIDKSLVPDCLKLYNFDEEECFFQDSKTYDYDKRLLYGLQLSEEEYKTLKK